MQQGNTDLSHQIVKKEQWRKRAEVTWTMRRQIKGGEMFLKAIKSFINPWAAASSREHSVCPSLASCLALCLSLSHTLISDVVQWNVVLSLQMDLAESTKIYLPLDTRSLANTGMTMRWSFVNPQYCSGQRNKRSTELKRLSKCVHDCVRD